MNTGSEKVIMLLLRGGCVYVLQLNQLKLELDNAIHAHRWPSNSNHVTKTCVPLGTASSPHQPRRVPLKPTTKKSCVFLVI